MTNHATCEQNKYNYARNTALAVLKWVQLQWIPWVMGYFLVHKLTTFHKLTKYIQFLISFNVDLWDITSFHTNKTTAKS